MAKPRWSGTKQYKYRSGFELRLIEGLRKGGIPVEYEAYCLNYTIPSSLHTYTPDLMLPNGILVELKGLFDLADRKKHVLIREQHPDLDVRIVFQNANLKIYKGSKTTYGMFCDKYDIIWADKAIPKEWFREPKKPIHDCLKPKK